jgi:FkbM family methyltransferase
MRQWLGLIKQQLKMHCPSVAASLHLYRILREMNRYSPKLTPYGFTLMGNQLMQEGIFEPEESALIIKYLKKASVFIDIGANIGFYICLARYLNKYPIAIEPSPQNLNLLYANLTANGWHDVEVYPLGMAAKPGIVPLYGGGTGASLVESWANNSGVLQQTISTSTLDILLGDRFQGKPLLIKVDVEGAEYSVLQGAASTLARTPAPHWILEICFTEHFPSGINPHFEAIFRLFWEHGYTARAVGPDDREVTPEVVERWVRQRQRDFGYVSYLFEKDTP